MKKIILLLFFNLIIVFWQKLISQELYAVDVDRAYFYSKPEDDNKLGSYVIHNDQLTCKSSIQNSFRNCTYTNAKGVRTSGYIKIKQLSFINLKDIRTFKKQINAEKIEIDEEFISKYIISPYNNLSLLHFLLEYTYGDLVTISSYGNTIQISNASYFNEEEKDSEHMMYDDYYFKIIDINNDLKDDILITLQYTSGHGSDYSCSVFIYHKQEYQNLEFDIYNNCNDMGLEDPPRERNSVIYNDKKQILKISEVCEENGYDFIEVNSYYKIKEHTNQAFLVKTIKSPGEYP